MPNIEIKARCNNPQKAQIIAKKYQTEYLGVLHQIDTYFRTQTGRLKLREINGKIAQLIPYKKDYQTGPMKSEYTLLPVADPKVTKELLSALLGVEFVVDKLREVFLIENVRVHLDRVQSLGEFIEFEAVCSSDSEEEFSRQTKKIQELMVTFEIQPKDLLDKSYVDYMTTSY
jgi:adenylate cyclase class 2